MEQKSWLVGGGVMVALGAGLVVVLGGMKGLLLVPVTVAMTALPHPGGELIFC